MGTLVTTNAPAAVRSRVGNSGSGGAAVGPGWLFSARFDRHFIATTAAIAILSGVAVAQRPGLFLPILMLDLWLLGYHHVVSTYTRLCFDAENFRQRRWMIFGLLPAVFADGTGTASFPLPVPAPAVGRRVWFHAVDVFTSQLSNGINLVVQ